MDRIKLKWVSKFQDLVASDISDKEVIKRFLMYGIKQEDELTKLWKKELEKYGV